MWGENKVSHCALKMIDPEHFFTSEVLLFFFQIPHFDANIIPSQDPLQPLQQDQPIQTSQVLINIYITLSVLKFNKSCTAKRHKHIEIYFKYDYLAFVGKVCEITIQYIFFNSLFVFSGATKGVKWMGSMKRRQNYSFLLNIGPSAMEQIMSNN